MSPPPPPLPSLNVPPLIGISAVSTKEDSCRLTISPSTLVVRFGDPVTANCSLHGMGFPVLGWVGLLVTPEPTMNSFQVWSEDSMTEWSLKPMCFALSETGGRCDIVLTLIVYKPPENVSVSFVNHTGPMFEGHQYTLQCTVQDVAPVENLTVTFYRGQTALERLQSNSSNTKKTPVTEIFTLDISASKEHDGVQYWCEAELQLGPEGPPYPPVVRSQNISAAVYFGPQFVCPTKLHVREGESLGCEVRGNPQPLVTWLRAGQVVAPPAHSSREHAGKYTVLAKGHHGQINFTVEVEVLADSGTANSCKRHFLLAVLFIQTINWL
ncbi:vascular cell adhesion protein 1-like [Pempheris klunzingeri]|uniref:vascular cell adhesion protein 1-like n=1 Tax=Pempheris klunzingeri TaxID=3127111 RepID=UPI00397ECD40